MLRIFALLLVYFFTSFARPYFVLAQLLIHFFGHKQLYAVGSFQFQQLDFPLNTTRITDQAAAGTHHTVARDDKRNGVMSHGSAHRLGGQARRAMLCRKPGGLENGENPTLSPYCSLGEVQLRATASADTAEKALALLTPLLAEVKARLGNVVKCLGGCPHG